MGSKIDRAWVFIKKLGIGFLGTLVEVPLFFIGGHIWGAIIIIMTRLSIDPSRIQNGYGFINIFASILFFLHVLLYCVLAKFRFNVFIATVPPFVSAIITSPFLFAGRSRGGGFMPILSDLGLHISSFFIFLAVMMLIFIIAIYFSKRYNYPRRNIPRVAAAFAASLLIGWGVTRLLWFLIMGLYARSYLGSTLNW